MKNKFRNNQKGIAPIIIALIVAVVLGGGYFIVKQQGNKKSEVKLISTQTSATDTSDWKIYKNDKYGFEIKLPSDWQVILNQNANNANNANFSLNSLENVKKIEEFRKEINAENIQGTDAGPQNNLTIFSYLSSGSLEEYIKINSDFINSQKITFAGEVAFKGKLIGLYDPVTILVKKGDRFYSIGLESANGMDAQLSDKILSTFKFTAPATITSDWKTYTDANMGVLVKYPSSWTYQEFSCNLAGVAFCPLVGNSLLNCKQTCGMNSPVSPIYLNYGNTIAETNLKLKSTDYEYKKIYDQMISTFKFIN